MCTREKLRLAVILFAALASGCERGADCRLFLMNGSRGDIVIEDSKGNHRSIPQNGRIILPEWTSVRQAKIGGRTVIYPKDFVNIDVCIGNAEYRFLFAQIDSSGSIQLIPSGDPPPKRPPETYFPVRPLAP